MNNQYLSNVQADKINQDNPTNQVTGLGSKVQAALQGVGGLGNRYYLDPTNGNDSYDGLSVFTGVKSLATAYAMATANKNDSIYFVRGATSVSRATAFNWQLAYTNMIGLTPGGPFQRCRIGHSADFATLFTVTANGCIFGNLHFQQGASGDTLALNNVVLAATSNYNTFYGCHFYSPLDATVGAGAYVMLTIAGSGTTGARSNAFYNCWFGDWTAAPTSTSGHMVTFGAATAGTYFEDCVFIINSSQTSFVPISAAVDVGGGNAAGWIHFKRCSFIGLNAKPAVICTAPTTGKIIFDQCTAYATAWSGSSNNVLVTNSYLGDATAGLGHVVP